MKSKISQTLAALRSLLKTMVARTAGPIRGPDFFGPYFFGPYFFVPVRGPDFSVRIFIGPVRVRIFLFWKKKYPDHGPDCEKIRTGTDYLDQKIRTTDRTSENPDQKIRTTDRTKNIRTEKSGPRTGPGKSGPKNPDHVIYPDRSGFSVRSGQPCKWLFYLNALNCAKFRKIGEKLVMIEGA